MSNVINLDAFRKDDDELGRLVEDDVLDVFLVSFWDKIPYADLSDSPEVRRRTRQAMHEVVLYLRRPDDRSSA